MPKRSLKADCPVCGGDEITVNGSGVLVRHRERVMTPHGPANGRDMCAGGGEKPEQSVDHCGERFPTFSELNEERWTR